MFKHFINLILLPAVLLLSLNCIKPVDNTPSDPSTTGLWLYSFPPIPTITTDSLHVRLAINTDSSYTLELIERTDKQLFSSTGTWDATDDSIFLTGNHCTILDTSADPDTLALLDAATCEKPIALAQPDQAELWTIQTLSLTTMLTAFPIPETLVASIPIFFPEVPLVKKSD